jgi:hypothetical protein
MPGVVATCNLQHQEDAVETDRSPFGKAKCSRQMFSSLEGPLSTDFLLSGIIDPLEWRLHLILGA